MIRLRPLWTWFRSGKVALWAWGLHEEAALESKAPQASLEGHRLEAMDLFVYNRSGQKDWWRRYSVRMQDGRTLSVRSGEGRWVTGVSVPQEISIKASRVQTSAVLNHQEDHQGAIEFGGRARHLIASPQDIEVQFKKPRVSELSVPDWRAEGYRVPAMVAGFLAYFAICLAWIAFVVGIVTVKGSSALFFLIGAVPPIYVITILARLVNDAVVSSRTVLELRSGESESIQYP